MKRNIKLSLDLFVEADENASEDELLEIARNMIEEDGLCEYINVDNLIEVK